jgi:hypothetical protein
MQTITTIGLDIAKSVYQVHGIDAQGNHRPPAGNARHVLFQVRTSKIAEVTSRQLVTRMTRYAADAEPERHAAMLNCAVRIIKLGTCRCDLRQ